VIKEQQQDKNVVFENYTKQYEKKQEQTAHNIQPNLPNSYKT
jgi:hypothetical protein